MWNKEVFELVNYVSDFINTASNIYLLMQICLVATVYQKIQCHQFHKLPECLDFVFCVV